MITETPQQQDHTKVDADNTGKKVDRIVEQIDSSTLLGAAWDCLSDAARARFKLRLSDIIQGT